MMLTSHHFSFHSFKMHTHTYCTLSFFFSTIFYLKYLENNIQLSGLQNLGVMQLEKHFNNKPKFNNGSNPFLA